MLWAAQPSAQAVSGHCCPRRPCQDPVHGRGASRSAHTTQERGHEEGDLFPPVGLKYQKNVEEPLTGLLEGCRMPWRVPLEYLSFKPASSPSGDNT